jgi:hypothetical protein
MALPMFVQSGNSNIQTTLFLIEINHPEKVRAQSRNVDLKLWLRLGLHLAQEHLEGRWIQNA